MRPGLNNPRQVEQEIRQWLQQAVIGLNLCPFAARPLQQGSVRIQVTDCEDEAALLQVLFDELLLLQETPAQSIETTLLVLTQVLQSFEDYNQFLDLAEQLLADRDWRGVFQIASFHPGYRFQGVPADSPENLTNRSPYPVLHLLREETLHRVLEDYPEPEKIPQQNIQTMRDLSAEQIHQIFPYLFGPLDG
jgi:hypothetical protein